MQIRYASKSPYEPNIAVTGSREDFIDLAELIEFADDSIKAVMPKPAGSPAPYDQYLKYIIVRATPGRAVCISLAKGNRLLIEGNKSKLAILAKNVRGFGQEAKESDHQHIDYFPNHFYLAPESIAMLLDFYPNADASKNPNT
jgi:hypothetical protein